MMANVWGSEKQCRAVVATAALSIMLMVAGGCGSGGSDGGAGPSVSAASGTVTGQVVSLANNAPVSGAAVKTETGTTTTAADGKFSLPAPVGDRTVVRVEASGFAEAFPVVRVTSGQTANLGVKLVPIGVTETVSVTAGGTVSVPNSPARVTIPASGLVPVAGGAPAGSVKVSVTPIDPTEEPRVMPGGFNGITAGGGSVQPLESGGAIQIDIRDSAGARYTLAQNTTATIRIPLRTQSANPPATMPLWYFDDAEGVWREDGVATLQGTGANRFYEGSVTRVTYWNADLVLDSIVVNGCVKDANGQPVANAFVQTEGIDYTGTAFDSTAADGTFSVAMRKSSRAKLGLFEFDRQTFNFVPVSNTVNVGPSATDINLSDCLVKQPGPLAITTAALPGGNVGVAYNQTVAASGGVPGYVWSLNTGSNPLPDGLTLNPAGVISGTPGTAGTTTITIKVTDSTGATKTNTFTLEINGVSPPPPPPPPSPLLTITTVGVPGGTVGIVYNATVEATGGTGNRTWSVSSGTLPAGLVLNAASGVISGTPTTAGTSKITLRVQDSGNSQQSAQKAYDLMIRVIETLKITSTSPLSGGKVGTVYNTSVTAKGGTGTLSWSVVGGALPTGLTLNPSTGSISGTPTTAGTSSVTLRVQDSGSPQQSAQKAVDLTINGTTPPPPPPPPSCGTGTTNCLRVNEIGKFVPNRPTSTGSTAGVGTITWTDFDGESASRDVLRVSIGETGLVSATLTIIDFTDSETAVFGCTNFETETFPGCSGLRVDRSAGTATFANVVLSLHLATGSTESLRLNGTLTFTPF